MKTISILNLKGGVAKTFTAANMAYEIYRRGYRVLLIDNDKQGNLSKAYSRYDAESVAPVTRLLAGDWQGTGSSRRSSICDDMHSKSGVDNNSASMDIAVCDMEKGA